MLRTTRRLLHDRPEHPEVEKVVALFAGDRDPRSSRTMQNLCNLHPEACNQSLIRLMLTTVREKHDRS
jgi:hypothetical protein